MHIGERIERRASKLGVSAQDIAAKCGITDKSVYQWFSGSTKNIRPENLVKTAEILKTTERWLALEEGPEDRPETAEALSPEAAEALDAWEALSPAHKVAMLFAMKSLAPQEEQWIPGVSPDRRRIGRTGSNG